MSRPLVQPAAGTDVNDPVIAVAEPWAPLAAVAARPAALPSFACLSLYQQLYRRSTRVEATCVT